ncbi:MAG: DUF3883 domain-containing protein [Caulobacter sp.]
MRMPLVLTTNEFVPNPDHAWNDVEGVQYHYPNAYKNKIRPGEEFVYYRGVLRKRGPRGQAEYFGRGRIGEITPDPATIGQSRPSWFCSIESYTPFMPPVPAKRDGIFYEIIPQNMWRNGVRSLDQATFDRILEAARAASATTIPTLASLADRPQEVDNLIIPKAKVVGSGKGGGLGYRRSKRSKEVGDWAEQLVVEFLKSNAGCVDIVHRAANAETPGWDIDYRDEHGVLHRVEVKGTVSGAFSAIDLTANELRAAQQHGSQYWIFLVANCLTDHPRIQRICAPADKIAGGSWVATPALFSVSLS